MAHRQALHGGHFPDGESAGEIDRLGRWYAFLTPLTALHARIADNLADLKTPKGTGHPLWASAAATLTIAAAAALVLAVLSAALTPLRPLRPATGTATRTWAAGPGDPGRPTGLRSTLRPAPRPGTAGAPVRAQPLLRLGGFIVLTPRPRRRIGRPRPTTPGPRYPLPQRRLPGRCAALVCGTSGAPR